MKKLNTQFFILFTAMFIIAIGFVSAQAQRPNPSQQETDEWRRKGPCSDPWVSMAVTQSVSSTRLAHTSNGRDGECDTSQYNQGQWGSYAVLYQAVEQARDDMSRSGHYWESYTKGGNRALFLLGPDVRILSANLIGLDGTTLVGHDGSSIQKIIARLVAAGGGNMVAAGGMNLQKMLKVSGLIGNDGASMVAAGGMNLQQQQAMLNMASKFAGSLVLQKATPMFRLNTAAKKSFKVGSVYYVVQ